jgi:Ca-activated chloride channel family protein
MPEIVILTDAEIEGLTSEDEQGFGALLTDQGPLPLKGLDVQAGLEGLIAQVSMTQTFVNTHAEPLEATYIFPLPDRAAVTSFRMEVAGRIVEGILKERSAARCEYDEALQAGHRAAITEQERPGVFTMRVGNLPPGEKATVRLTMIGPLVYDSGQVTFRFPLVVAPRYIPGTPLEGQSVGAGVAVDTDAVPDASRISPPVLLPGYPYPVRFTLTVDVASAGLPVRGFRSSLHAVIEKGVGSHLPERPEGCCAQMAPAGALRVTVQPGERLNRDFILRYQLGEESVTTSLLLVPDTGTESREGTFLVTVMPPAPTESRQLKEGRPRDVVFVLDRSGSMAGWKMVAARRALGRMVDTLTERDRFAVLAFDDALETPPICQGGLVPASDRNRFRAIEWLGQIDARGGTEMAQPLDLALAQLTSERDRVLVLVTDGQVGNEDQLLQAFAQRVQGIRIFTLGIDTAVNEAFLKRLAALGGGSCDLVESEDRLDEVMDKVQRRIGAPLWTGLQLEAHGIRLESDSQVPARLPDLFPGVALTILGRYRGGEGGLVLKAVDEAGRPLAQTFAAHVSHNPAIAQVWARGRLRDLEDRWIVGAQESPAELEKKIVALSLRFGVLCRFTAFVAVDRSQTVNEGGRQQRLIQPVELPAGWALGIQKTAMCMPAVAAHLVYRGYSSPRISCQKDMASAGDYECMMEALEEDLAQQSPADLGSRYLGEVEQEAVPAGDDLNLTAYRQRAQELLEELRADPDVDHALGVLAVKLKALVDDLKSIGAPAAVLEPLLKLLEEIRSTPQQLQEIRRQQYRGAEIILAAFVGAAPALAPPL